MMSNYHILLFIYLVLKRIIEYCFTADLPVYKSIAKQLQRVALYEGKENRDLQSIKAI